MQLATPADLKDEQVTFISSPSLRCGTTLLQRLLTSSSNGMIYGENVAADMSFYLQAHLLKSSQYANSAAFFDQKLDAVKGGDYNLWIPDLMPPAADYLKALETANFSVVRLLRDQAASMGRSQWGIKVSGWNFAFLNMIRMVLPEVRFVYMVRNPLDCVKSALGVQIIPEQQAVEFAKAYAGTLQDVLSNNQKLGAEILRYEDLVANPAEAMGGITAFNNYQDIDFSVMDQKINTQSVAGGKGYLEPSALSEELESAIREAVGPVMADLYPEF